MSAAWVFRQFGNPAEVIQSENIPDPPLSAGEVRIAMEASPIHPADLNFLEGRYGVVPELPAVPGMEGVGSIVESRDPFWAVGERVLVAGPGCWQERVVRAGDRLVRVPEGLAIEQAAMARINPSTAWWMLHCFGRPRPGDWLVQNAGTSGVGCAVIQLARFCGWRTASFIRGTDRFDSLRALGADAVFEESAAGCDAAKEVLAGHSIRLALNAVGGESLLRLASLVEDSAVVVTYGAMGRQANKIPNSLLIFRRLQFTGFWLTAWERSCSQHALLGLRQRLLDWMAAGALRLPVGTVFPAAEAGVALAAACQGGVKGKVVLRWGQG